MIVPSEGMIRLRKTLFEMLVLLVDAPEQVRVASTLTERHVVLQVSVAPEDTGKVIGKQGRTARSLRTILGACAVKLGVTCDLNIAESPKKVEVAHGDEAQA